MKHTIRIGFLAILCGLATFCYGGAKPRLQESFIPSKEDRTPQCMNFYYLFSGYKDSDKVPTGVGTLTPEQIQIKQKMKQFRIDVEKQICQSPVRPALQYPVKDCFDIMCYGARANPPPISQEIRKAIPDIYKTLRAHGHCENIDEICLTKIAHYSAFYSYSFSQSGAYWWASVRFSLLGQRDKMINHPNEAVSVTSRIADLVDEALTQDVLPRELIMPYRGAIFRGHKTSNSTFFVEGNHVALPIASFSMDPQVSLGWCATLQQRWKKAGTPTTDDCVVLVVKRAPQHSAKRIEKIAALPGEREVLMGSHCYRVVRTSECNVMVRPPEVRPDDDYTPARLKLVELKVDKRTPLTQCGDHHHLGKIDDPQTGMSNFGKGIGVVFSK